MDELISRQAAIGCLDDKITVTGEQNAIEIQNYIRRVANRLNDLPSVQPEVVRCKDCRYVWNEDGWDNLWCNRLTGSFSVEKDGGCSWGKI